MAFKPSHRRKKPGYILDLNIAPFLSLFVALIPMLLLTAFFQKVGIVNLYLPTLEEALLEEGVTDAGGDFTLAVTVTPTELTLRRDDKVLLKENIVSRLNLERLTGALVRIKQAAPQKRDAVLLLDGRIRYETIIDVMDAVRENEGVELFPEISLADRILEGS